MLAQNLDLDTIQKEAFGGKFKFSKIADLFGPDVLRYVFGAAGILLLLYLLFGGLQLMFSAGDPKKTQSAQGKITNALIGFVIVFLAYWITQLIASVLGLQGTYFGEIFGLQ